jgi:hypothetical protein
MPCSQVRLAPPCWSTCRSDRQNTRPLPALALLLLLLLVVVVVVVEGTMLALLLLLVRLEVVVVSILLIWGCVPEPCRDTWVLVLVLTELGLPIRHVPSVLLLLLLALALLLLAEVPLQLWTGLRLVALVLLGGWWLALTA